MIVASPLPAPLWQRLADRARTKPWAAAFVLTVWAVGSAGLVYLVAEHTWNVPFSDEWVLVPRITGEAPVTPGWLWGLHNEHRLPLPRLVQIVALRLFWMDFRATPYVSVAMLSLLALASIVTAARVRGRVSCWDACLPLLLLSWVHADSVLSGWQVQFVLSTAAALTFLLGVVAGGADPGTGVAVTTGAAVVTLPLCGGSGFIMTPVLTGWLILAGRRAWRQGRRLCGVVFGMFAAVATGLMFAYLIGWHPPPVDHPAAPISPWDLIIQTAEFLGLDSGSLELLAWQCWAFGAVCIALLIIACRSCMHEGAWRRVCTIAIVVAGIALTSNSSGLLTYLLLRPVQEVSAWQACGLLGLAPLAASLLLLSRANIDARRQGLGLFMLAMLLLAVGIVWGRLGLGSDMHWYTRYATLVTPLWCAIYFVWLLYAPTAQRGAGLSLLCALSALMALSGSCSGLAVAELRRDVQLGSFEWSLQHQALSPDTLARDYTTCLTPIYPQDGEACLAHWIRLLRDAGHPEFCRLPKDGR